MNALIKLLVVLVIGFFAAGALTAIWTATAVTTAGALVLTGLVCAVLAWIPCVFEYV